MKGLGPRLQFSRKRMEVEKLRSASVALQRMMGSVVLGAVFAAQNSLVLLLFLIGALPSDIDVFPHLSETEKRFLYGNLDKAAMSEESKNSGECVDDEDDDNDDDNVDDSDDEDDYSGEGSNMDDDDNADSDDEVQANGDGGSDEDDEDDDDDGDDDDEDDDDDSEEEDHQLPPKKKK